LSAQAAVDAVAATATGVAAPTVGAVVVLTPFGGLYDLRFPRAGTTTIWLFNIAMENHHF